MANQATKRGEAAKKAARTRKRRQAGARAAATKKRRAAAVKARKTSAQKHAQAEAERLKKLWADHLDGEFVSKDVEATLATMVEDASVNHVPVKTGGRGKEELRAFYRDDFIPSWPDDLRMEVINRVVGDGQLVEELRLRFTHSKRMDWFLPGVPPTGRPVDVPFVVVVQFRGDKLACERIYWDQATVLRQVGLLGG